jgi:hypothetical protein
MAPPGTRLLTALLGCALAPVALGAPAPSSVPDELSSDRLDRAAILALPAVYRVDVRYRVTGLRTRTGRVIPVPPLAQNLGQLGTAFAVSPQGHLVSAKHVVAPGAEQLATDAYLQTLAVEGKPHTTRGARDWVRTNGARPVGVSVVSRTVRRASADPRSAQARTFTPRVVATDSLRDLALLSIPARDAPSLVLDDAREPGTPVVALGFGRDDAFGRQPRPELSPALRKGRLGESGRLEGAPQRLLTRITADVRRGDSGGPVVDDRGRVRGVVSLLVRGGGGAIEPTTEVTRLLAQAGVRNAEGRTQALFARAMQRLWALDLDGAIVGLRATESSFRDHPLAAYERQRVERLSASEFRLQGAERHVGLFLALGVTAALVAAGCALRLARTRLRR